MFNAASLLLYLDGYEFKKHSGVISKFSEAYIKTGILDEKLGKYLSDGFKERDDVDYRFKKPLTYERVIRLYNKGLTFYRVLYL